MKKVKDADLPMNEMAEVLKTPTRLFREGRTDETFKDWYFDEKGNIISQGDTHLMSAGR
jgi:hypothetical protein